MTDVPDIDRLHRESVEDGRQQIIANRWAAFTDDELGNLMEAMEYLGERATRSGLFAEVVRELSDRSPHTQAARTEVKRRKA